jgi:lipopolysaccharide export system permease protein
MLSRLLMLFGFFSLVLVSVYWINRAVSLFDRLIGDGQTATVFVEFTLLMLPNVVRLVLPVSAFVAAVYVTNRLSNDNEFLVMQATGFSSFRLARPVLIFGLVVALLMSAMTHWLGPQSRAELTKRTAEIAENVTARFLSAGRFLNPADGITLFIEEITPEGELRNLMLVDARNDRSRTTYTARRALLVRDEAGPRLVMIEGMIQTLDLNDQRLFTTTFEDFAHDIGTLINRTGAGRTDPRTLSTRRLMSASPETQAMTGRSRGVLLYEAHDRFAQPLLATAAALIGFSALTLGAFSRFGVSRQIFGAILLLVLVVLVNNAMGNIVPNDARLIALTYAAPLFGFALAGVMLWFSDRPRRGRNSVLAPVGAGAGA